jgi:cyclopropane fatty-acyl-phospholipid synthase-like methyltransferase
MHTAYQGAKRHGALTPNPPLTPTDFSPRTGQGILMCETRMGNSEERAVDATAAATSRNNAMQHDSRIVSATHPDRLAAMATLYGLKPPTVDVARVLEIGCADGGNLLAMAQSLPDATFVGVDPSERLVAEGRTAIASLGIANVDLRSMDLVDIDESLGTFDYIVCNGVYSWIPPEARTRVLAICARQLSPDGITYVSYNTYPGWHLRGLARELMRYHTATFPTPAAKVREARGLIDFLARVAIPADGSYAKSLHAEAELLAKKGDDFVFHEHLETENHPVYFHEFISEARQASLNYVGPARFMIVESNLPQEVLQGLSRVSTDRVRYEQYLDFVLGRSMRQSLLCHADRAPLDVPSVERIRDLRVTASAAPDSAGPDVQSEEPVRFRTQYGDQITVARPILKVAVVALYERWPRSAGFEEIWNESLIRLDRPGTAGPGEDRDGFARFLLEAHLANLVDFHTYDPPFTLTPGEKPVGAALARRQAAGSSKVVSLRNTLAELHDLDRALLPQLDGTRDRAALVDLMADWVTAGHLSINREDQSIVDPAEARAILQASLEERLKKLAADALIVT